PEILRRGQRRERARRVESSVAARGLHAHGAAVELDEVLAAVAVDVDVTRDGDESAIGPNERAERARSAAESNPEIRGVAIDEIEMPVAVDVIGRDQRRAEGRASD